MKALKCDNCGCDIPLITKKFLGKEIQVFDTGNIHLKECDTGSVFEHCELCKRCANEISMTLDYELLKFKTKALRAE